MSAENAAPIETLREAAALMRERAESSTPGPWVVGWARPCVYTADGEVNVVRQGKVTDTPHIASWHPTVALAVADLLDWSATFWEAFDGDYASSNDEPLLRVARAYLGESA